MVTEIYPNESLKFEDGTEITGFRVGKEFIHMRPHKGHVECFTTLTGRYRFGKAGNSKSGNAMYKKRCYSLEIVPFPVEEFNVCRVLVQSQDEALIIRYLEGEKDAQV
jgi:hypothetical protein